MPQGAGVKQVHALRCTKFHIEKCRSRGGMGGTMKTWHEEIPCPLNEPLTAEIFTEHAVVFDIETTGFSPAHTNLYMIGCVSRKSDTLKVDQFFAEETIEEKLLLLSFINHIEPFDTVISFNGTGFDIPYLKAKCSLLGVKERLSAYTHIDLYKVVSQLKNLLKTENCKQKSIEQFLGIRRDDTQNGGDLIDVYKNYLKKPNKEALFLLKQHNYDDIVGLPSLLPILAYERILRGNYCVASIEGIETMSQSKEQRKELQITLTNDYPAPRRVSCGNALYYLSIYKDKTQINVKLYDGELKFFFKDYKNYYYLPKEDAAVHKSLSTYVDKKYREPAVPQNCYTKKKALFVPQYREVMKPKFVENYKDKLTYFELTEDFTESDVMLRRYVKQVFETLFDKNANKRKD